MRVAVCDCGDLTCPRTHPSLVTRAVGLGKKKPTYPPRYCLRCDTRLSRYNSGPACWRHGP